MVHVCIRLWVFERTSVLIIKECVCLFVCLGHECTHVPVLLRRWCIQTPHSAENNIKWVVYQKAFILCSSNKSVPVKVCMFIFHVHLSCLPFDSRPQPTAWKMDSNIGTNGIFFLHRQDRDFPPDTGRDQAEQSRSFWSADTFGPAHCLGGGHSEQSRGQRSFHCTSCPGFLRSVENMKGNV